MRGWFTTFRFKNLADETRFLEQVQTHREKQPHREFQFHLQSAYYGELLHADRFRYPLEWKIEGTSKYTVMPWHKSRDQPVKDPEDLLDGVHYGETYSNEPDAPYMYKGPLQEHLDSSEVLEYQSLRDQQTIKHLTQELSSMRREVMTLRQEMTAVNQWIVNTSTYINDAAKKFAPKQEEGL